MVFQPSELERKKERAVQLYNDGYLMEARQACGEICELDGEDPAILCLLGVIYGQLNQFHKAAEFSERAISIYPEYEDAHYNLALALRQQGKTEKAIKSLQFVLSRRPDDAGVHYSLGFALEGIGDYDGAVLAYRKAQAIQHDYQEAFAGEAAVYEKRGDIDTAYEIIRPYVENTELSNSAIAVVYGRLALATGKSDSLGGKLERFLETSELSADERLHLHFVLGQFYDRIGRYDDAFNHFREANELKGTYFDIHKFACLVDRKISLFSAEQFVQAKRSDRSSERPVFVVGMMRSGTSLVEQILASHSRVFGAGELSDMENIAASLEREQPVIEHLSKQQLNRYSDLHLEKLNALDSEALRVVDKMPQNFLHLGYIALLFPDARVIHCRRDPIDTCLSCYFQDFTAVQEHAFNLEALGHYYNEYVRLMDHWKQGLDIPVHEVRYEELVSDTDAEIGRILDFCSLDFESGCLDFHKNRRAVTTASYGQVHRPIYNSSVKRWRNYEQHIGRLIDIVSH